MRVSAYAKINLSLRVLGIRPDGYHELRTIFQSIALHDTLTARVRRGPFALQCDDPACPVDETNLVWRAAERVWAAAGRRRASRRRETMRGVEVRLTKRIPLQAGLGGGSSDAAAALRVLGSLWRVKDARLREIAATLGADVPYFLEGGTVLGLDRGDLLYPLVDYPTAWVTLVVPPFGVSTVDAFRWWDETGRALLGPASGPPSDYENVGRTLSGPPSGFGPASDLENDLQGPVAVHHPEIARIVSALQKAGAFHAAMSGSGSAVFGLFSRRPEAERAARVLQKKDARVLLTRTINRAVYQRQA